MSQETIASNSLAKMLLITKHTKNVDKSANPASKARNCSAQWERYRN